MKYLSIAAAAVALISAPTMAASPTGSVVGKDAEAAAKQRVICKTSNQIGSRLRKTKSCRTAQEWADLTFQTQEKTRDVQRVAWKPPGT